MEGLEEGIFLKASVTDSVKSPTGLWLPERVDSLLLLTLGSGLGGFSVDGSLWSRTLNVAFCFFVSIDSPSDCQ